MEPTRAAVEAALAGFDREALATSRWFGAKGRTVKAVALEDAFVLDDAAPHVLAIARLVLDAGPAHRYTFALTGRPLRPAEDRDGAWRALLVAIAEGRTIASIASDATRDRPGPVSAALVCRPAVALARLVPGGPGAVRDLAERPLGADQSNSSVVIGERVLLKGYRRLEPGLNPELELLAFLTEEAGFPAVPPLAGFAEVVSTA
ncbi:MAG TPA: hypothetical protein VFW02_09930, partial [Candidatus Limnocylindrales bacterium]|nr:hypothetical protein [Candidatus Limnocylindrales bacterium]